MNHRKEDQRDRYPQKWNDRQVAELQALAERDENRVFKESEEETIPDLQKEPEVSLAHENESVEHHQRYNDKAFQSWDDKSSVRNQPRRVIQEGMEKGLFAFSPGLVPIITHSLVKERGAKVQARLVLQQFFHYMNFTELLEHEVVNQLAFRMGRGRVPCELPQQMKLDAYKLYVDEAYHSLFSADLSAQMEQATGVLYDPQTPYFLKRLKQITQGLSEADKWLVLSGFTIVSETLISGTLSKIPKDKRVIRAVREMIADHAIDEGRHHKYFAEYLKILWPQLNEKQKRLVGPMLAEFILLFLQPDLEVIRGDLLAQDFSPYEASLILEESYPQQTLMEEIRTAAQTTMKYFKQYGLFHENYIIEAFERRCLL